MSTSVTRIRPSNAGLEDTNGLLRQYFTKGTDLGSHGLEELERVSLLNNRNPS